MFEVRIHGRGGQGVVSAAEMLSIAAFTEGRFAQAIPSFGSERMGAPVVSYCRMDDRMIRTREPVMEPDAIIIQDVTLVHQVAVFEGLRPDGYILFNTSRTLDELGLGELGGRFRGDRMTCCPATDLALEELGRPLPNAALLGGFAALTEVVTLDAVDTAIRQVYPGDVAEQNVAAAAAAFRFVAIVRSEMAHVAAD